jgi:hypothetical protein
MQRMALALTMCAGMTLMAPSSADAQQRQRGQRDGQHWGRQQAQTWHHRGRPQHWDRRWDRHYYRPGHRDWHWDRRHWHRPHYYRGYRGYDWRDPRYYPPYHRRGYRW